MSERPIDIARRHLDAGRPEQARAALTRLLQSSPRDADAVGLMATILVRLGSLDQAEFFARRAVEAAPADPASHQLLVSTLSAAFLLDDAIRAADAGLAAVPGDLELLGARSRVLLLLGRAEEAVASLRQAARAQPDSIGLARRLAFTATYDPGTDARTLFELHRRAGGLLAESVPDRPRPRTAPDAERPLRIGFLSSDLCNHVVAFFLFPLLVGLDRRQFQVVCYSTAPREDAISQKLRSLVGGWRHAPLTSGVHPEQLAAAIRADAIDLLVELGGYSGGSPFDVTAYRPAPIQVSYLGYPGTTGFERIDARLVDSLTDATGAEGDPGRADEFAVERLVRLDPCFLCFRPPGADLPEPGPLPCEKAGCITFGSFNALQKINAPLLQLWAGIVAAVPGSRLVIKNLGFAQGAAREGFRQRLAGAGLDPARVDLLPPAGEYSEHLATYRTIDIALDTYPYCGTTTTCEALFMGVPVVSLVGGFHAARVGLSLLCTVGTPELAARAPEQYVRLATELATDRSRLAGLRGSLRERVLSGPLGDGSAFSARFGAAIRGLWREHCTGR